MTPVIEVPVPDDAAALGPLQLRVWLQTYPNAEAGVDEAWIREHRGFSATAEGIARRRRAASSVDSPPLHRTDATRRADGGHSACVSAVAGRRSR
ncbi:hypothetical protein [Streptomyces sp. NBC_00236]|uniref:hypothetical protein n=1 Tax=unclassified Streptomyces TaxID=2593676 RepID=UPI002E2DDBA4|nr:hypothetical protein [Streptomyces sp. NBC_00236]